MNNRLGACLLSRENGLDTTTGTLEEREIEETNIINHSGFSAPPTRMSTWLTRLDLRTIFDIVLHRTLGQLDVRLVHTKGSLPRTQRLGIIPIAIALNVERTGRGGHLQLKHRKLGRRDSNTSNHRLPVGLRHAMKGKADSTGTIVGLKVGWVRVVGAQKIK